MTGRKGSELKAKIQSGETVYGTFVGSTDIQITRMFAQLGFDYIIIDNEHSALNPETVQQMLQAFAAGDREFDELVGFIVQLVRIAP